MQMPGHRPRTAGSGWPLAWLPLFLPLVVLKYPAAPQNLELQCSGWGVHCWDFKYLGTWLEEGAPALTPSLSSKLFLILQAYSNGSSPEKTSVAIILESSAHTWISY